MMNITGALSAGYTARQILNYLGQVFPDFSDRIKDAVAAGKTAEDILKNLEKVDKKKLEKFRSNRRPSKIYPDEPSVNPYIAASEAQKQFTPVPEAVKTAANIGLGAAGAYGAAKLIPAVTKGLQKAFPALSNAIGPAPMANAPVPPPPISPSPLAESAPSNISVQTPQLGKEKLPLSPSASPINNSLKIIEEMGIGQQINNLAQAGNSPEQIMAAVNASLKPNQRKWLEDKIKKGEAKSLEEMIQDVTSEEGKRISSLQMHEKITPDVKEFLNKSIEEGKEKPLPEMLKEFEKKKKSSPLMQGIEEDIKKMSSTPEKGSLVATPNGNVGYVKDIKNTEALIDEDGKLHKLKIKDLQLPDETVVQTVTRLLEMPEIDKSSIINYWSYDPEDKELFLMFHNGETYKYLDVPSELEQELSEAAISPKTKGQNEFGAWSQEDPSSRGATFIQKLIAHPKYKKTGKGEKPNPFYRKLRKGYDYWTGLRK